VARALALLLIAAATVSAGATLSAPPSTRKGAYTEGQAEAGAQLYAKRCAMCHGRMLEGTFETPGLQGKFIVNWSKAPLRDLYDYLGRAMPQYAPGSLTPDENAKLVAFLLKANALPAGREELPASGIALQGIILEPREISLPSK
jgi:mono/diheme cytochrome c family protein